MIKGFQFFGLRLSVFGFQFSVHAGFVPLRNDGPKTRRQAEGVGGLFSDRKSLTHCRFHARKDSRPHPADHSIARIPRIEWTQRSINAVSKNGASNMRETLDDLLSKWEEGFERGQPPSAEMLCVNHPELLAELKSQIEALKAIESNFGTVMGRSSSSSDEGLRSSRLQQRLQITSDFQIDRLHASGGLGEVYLASEPSLKRQVAIKFPRKDRLSAQQMARFEREAQITGRLNHPGIVPVFSLKQDNSQQPCYVMRFIDGNTLRQRVEQLHQSATSDRDFFSTLEFRQLLQSFIALCNIVAYAHDQGIIHRDIKPENIILGPFGETMLMDWGLAKVLTEPAANLPPIPVSNIAETVTNRALKTVDGQVMGTPAYASPEQMQGRVDLTDSRSDIYSLGATLHFLLYGTNERTDKSESSPMNRNGSVVPKRLAAICRKALENRIEDRYQSVSTLREDLERFLAGEAISVVPETAWSRFVRSVRRRPGLSAATLVGVTMAILAGIAGSLMLNQKNRELSATNKQLASAIEGAVVAKQRATSNSDILKQALLSATPEQAQGKDPTVRQLLDRVSKQLPTGDPVNPLVAADTHQILSEAYVSLGVYESAQEHADFGHDIYERELGQNSAEAIAALAHRGLILSRRDRDGEAIEMTGEALERGRKLESIDPASLVTVIDIHAHVCSQAPDPDHQEIVALHREAHEIASAAFGSNHRTTLKMASNFATALMDSGDLVGAEVLLDEIHATHEALLGAEHPETLVDVFNLIALKFNQGDAQAANDLCQSNLSIFEKILGPEHQRSIRLRLLSAMSWLNLSRWDLAASDAALALARSKEHLGPLHQQTFEARGIMAGALIEAGKLDEAEKFSEEHFEIAKEAFGPTHPYTVQSVTLLFDLADKRNELDAMARWLEHLRGSPWEAPAAEQFKAAQERKKQQESAAGVNGH
jgi:serine/threonine protein kinase